MKENEKRTDVEVERLKKLLSKNIKQNRKKCRMSQQELADKCGLHRTYVSDMENAKCNPTLNVLVTISRCLGTTIFELLSAD